MEISLLIISILTFIISSVNLYYALQRYRESKERYNRLIGRYKK